MHDLVEGNALRLLKIVSRTCAEARLTCSEAVAAQLRLPSTTVAYAAIDTARFKSLPERDIARCELGLPAGVPVIGLVGRIARWKGQDRFIRIAASVLANQEAHFCIVGSAIFGCDEAYVTELHSTVVAYGLADRFSFVPWQKDMARVYAALDLSCNCSDREPFGRTSLEALASGVPIVCFDDAGVCEVLPGGRCAAVVAAGDERGFADAVEAYLNELDSLSAAGSEARRAAQRLDITQVYPVFARVLGLDPDSATDLGDREKPMLPALRRPVSVTQSEA